MLIDCFVIFLLPFTDLRNDRLYIELFLWRINHACSPLIELFTVLHCRTTATYPTSSFIDMVHDLVPDTHIVRISSIIESLRHAHLSRGLVESVRFSPVY